MVPGPLFLAPTTTFTMSPTAPVAVAPSASTSNVFTTSKAYSAPLSSGLTSLATRAAICRATGAPAHPPLAAFFAEAAASGVADSSIAATLTQMPLTPIASAVVLNSNGGSSTSNPGASVVGTSQVTAVSLYVQSSYRLGTIVGSPIPNVTRSPTAVRLPW